MTIAITSLSKGGQPALVFEKYLSPCVSPICNSLGITGFSLRGTIKRTGSGRLNGTNIRKSILLGTTKKRCRLVPKNVSNLVHKPSAPLMPDGESEYFALNEGLRRGKSRMRTPALAGRHK